MEIVGSYFESTIFPAMIFEHNINNIPPPPLRIWLVLLSHYPVLEFIEQDACPHLSKPVLSVEIGVAGVGIDIAVSIRTSLSKFDGVNWGFVLVFEIHEMLL